MAMSACALKMVEDYYELVQKLVTDAGSLARAKKLHNDVAIEAPKAEHIFVKYYQGSYQNLRTAICQREDACIEDVIAIDHLAQEAGFPPLETPMMIVNGLMDPERRSKYRRFIRKYQHDKRIVPLNEFETALKRIKGRW